MPRRGGLELKVLTVTNMYPTPAEPWFGCFVRDQVEDLQALGVDVTVLHFDGRRDRAEYVRAAKALRRLVCSEPYDLVHAHYGLTGAVALAQRRLPVVTTFHGSDTGYVAWQARVSRFVAARTVPLFVCAEGAKRIGCPRGAVIPSSVDTTLFAPIEREEARRRLGWEPDGWYALFPSARANPVKRADLFDAAVREARAAVPDLKAVSLEGYARRDVALVMNAVDVALLTSDSEGSPVAVKEALACLTPVVSVPVGDVATVIADLPGCSVTARDPKALGRGLLRALSARRSDELRRRAEQFSRPRIAERVVSFYEGVLAR